MGRINEEVRDEWLEETDGFDRVKTVLRQTTEPKSANEISGIADVADKTAKKHLERLVDLGVAERLSTGSGETYRRSRDWYVNREISRLRVDLSDEDLQQGIQRMLDDIRAYRRKYDAEAPEDLLMDIEPDDDREVWLDLSDWETTERNLAIARAAVRFEEASDLVDPDGAEARP